MRIAGGGSLDIKTVVVEIQALWDLLFQEVQKFFLFYCYGASSRA
jgi:hypothetical protein